MRVRAVSVLVRVLLRFTRLALALLLETYDLDAEKQELLVVVPVLHDG